MVGTPTTHVADWWWLTTLQSAASCVQLLLLFPNLAAGVLDATRIISPWIGSLRGSAMFAGTKDPPNTVRQNAKTTAEYPTQPYDEAIAPCRVTVRPIQTSVAP